MSHNLYSAPLTKNTVFSIMIEPAGDAKHAGRSIDDNFERGITLQCAEELKKMMEQLYPGVRIILSRFPGETLEPLQNAHFANRLAVDLYVSLHFFYENEEKPRLHIYQFCYHPITDFWKQTIDLKSFIPFDQAHKLYINRSQKYATIMHKTLSNQKHHTFFDTFGVHALPFKPLIGITVPALALEASLSKKDGWHVYLEPMVESLKNIIEYGLSQ